MRLVQLTADPMTRFVESFRSESTKESYVKKLKTFLVFASTTPTELVEKAQTDPQNVEGLILEYARLRKNSVSGSTIQQTMGAVRRFLVASRAHKEINWEELSQHMPKAKKIGRDRSPSVEEIRQLLGHCTPRLRCVILIMCSSGIRIGAFDYLKWRDVEPIDVEGKKFAKLSVYTGEDEQYTTFITPECYRALLDYRRSRERMGEKIVSDSPLIAVEKWNRAIEKGVPLAVSSKALSNEIGRLWVKAGFRTSHKKTHEFKQVHGFRKFFRTRCESSGVSTVFVEMLMGHKVGLAGNYTKPTPKELAEQYAKAIPSLTLSEAAEAKSVIEKKVLQSDRRVVDLERENLRLSQRLDRIEKGYDELKQMFDKFMKQKAISE
jgi:integrase